MLLIIETMLSLLFIFVCEDHGWEKYTFSHCTIKIFSTNIALIGALQSRVVFQLIYFNCRKWGARVRQVYHKKGYLDYFVWHVV